VGRPWLPKAGTGFLQYTSHRDRGRLVAYPLKEWNTESSNGVSPIIKSRKRNVDSPLHFVGLPFLLPPSTHAA
jgi:hypothetical protein